MRTRYLFYILAITGLSVALAKFEEFETAYTLSLDNAHFLEAAVASANLKRDSDQLRPLQTSQSLQDSIKDFLETQDMVTPAELKYIFGHIGQTLPQVHELSANLVFARNPESLMSELNRWEDLAYANHSHYAAWAFHDRKNRRLGCVAVLARELPTLELPLKAEGSGAFFTTCRLCNEGHGIKLAERAQNTLIVTCPRCDKAYDLIASDSHGQWRRATQFFTGLRSTKVEASMTPMEQVMTIWQDVASKCRYQLDAKRISGGDSWESPEETYRVGSGDCEDTSLLLVDMLTAHGFEARVALGQHRDGGHAWCVLKLGDDQYILESTWQDIAELKVPPSMDELGLDYHPQFLFDREAIYFPQREGWTCNYWSERNWQRILCLDQGSVKIASRVE